MAKVTNKLQVTVTKTIATADRLRLFDEASARQKERQHRRPRRSVAARGWTRDELYSRGR